MQSLSLVYTHTHEHYNEGFIESGEDGARGSFEIPLWQADKCQLTAEPSSENLDCNSKHTHKAANEMETL